MQYSKYFANKMKISQSYNEGNHKPHTTGEYQDFPIDETYGSTARDGWFLAPFDCKVVKKYRANSNQIWITSTDKVNTPIGSDYVTVFVCHISNDEYNKISVGDTYKQGEKILREYKDSLSTGNHNHVSAGLGKIEGTGWKQSNSKWVLQTTNGTRKPENIFYVDKSITKIIDDAGIDFKELPKEETKEEDFFGGLGYFKDGDRHENIGKIAEFMRKTFPAYTDEKALGNYYGEYIKASIKEFQKRAKAEGNYNSTIDGYTGKITLESLKKYGFKE